MPFVSGGDLVETDNTNTRIAFGLSDSFAKPLPMKYRYVIVHEDDVLSAAASRVLDGFVCTVRITDVWKDSHNIDRREVLAHVFVGIVRRAVVDEDEATIAV